MHHRIRALQERLVSGGFQHVCFFPLDGGGPVRGGGGGGNGGPGGGAGTGEGDDVPGAGGCGFADAGTWTAGGVSECFFFFLGRGGDGLMGERFT